MRGTEIVVGLADGRTLRSKDLVGAVLDVRFEGQPAKVRIVEVERDPTEQTGTVWLHTFEALQADGSWQNVCLAGPDGRRQGFPLQGTALRLEFTCSSGAIGKCVRFGYRPWATGPDGKSLAPQHAACVRMVRGDYGGDGTAWTRDGMLIDVFDPQGIQAADGEADIGFEAGWSPDGAVCLHHVRVIENTSLAELEQKYPHLKGRTGQICTEELARSLGAVVFNRSRP
ncbi:MAG TPA: ADYC domain-containing protein [Reyranella sp.]|nr:ADYC domain-containing protein [Reyranella sp.]